MEEMENCLCPVCGVPYQETRPMLRCDNCRDWYHGECVDFLCKSCKPEKAPTEETKEVDYYINRIEEMKKEQEKVKKNLRDIIATRDKELSQKTKKIENWGDDKNKTLNEAKQVRTENMSLKDELHLEKTKTKELENQLSKLKRNLDLSNSQFTKTRKEKNDAMKELTRKDTVAAKQEQEIDKLKAEKTTLEREVQTHCDTERGNNNEQLKAL